MQNQTTTGAALMALFLCLIGCGGGADQEQAGPGPEPAQDEPQPLGMVLETSEPTYSFGNHDEEEQAIDYVTLLVTNTPEDRGYTIRIDESYQRAGQLRVLLGPAADGTAEIDLEAEAEKLFEELKAAFDRHAMQAAYADLTNRTRQAGTLDSEVQTAQKKLRSFQESVRGLPDSDEIRLERRKLERKIETSLQAKIEAEKLVESAQKRIDRERFVTLLRVR